MATATASRRKTAPSRSASDAAAPTIRRTQLLIDGKWVDAKSGKTFPTLNPATEKKIADVALADAADVDRAVKAARAALESGPWSKMDARDRGKLLNRLADLVEQNLEELAALESLDNGKPIRDSRAADLPLVIDCLRYYAGWADKIHGDTIPVRGNYFCYTRREPVGVVGQIIPWNFPLLMVAWKWGPALATGCTIVMKPAEQTPLSCLRIAELAMEAGFPKGVINILPGYGETGAAIVKHPGVDKIAFTGSTETAQFIMRDAAQTLKRITFELGGKSPNVVFADANLDAAIAGAEFGLFFNQGQCCCAGSRLYVEQSIHDEFVDKVVKSAKARRLGSPLDPETTQGPQVDQTQFDKILKYIDLGQKAGAKCVTGGKRFGKQGYYIEPTVFTGVKDTMQIAREEIFGPVMSVIRFKDEAEAIAIANDSSYGLQASVWSDNVNRAHRVARALRAGTVHVNQYDEDDITVPFGGYKQSGNGRDKSLHAFDKYTELKTTWLRIDAA